MILLVSGLSGDWAQHYRDAGVGDSIGFLLTQRNGGSQQSVLQNAKVYAADNSAFAFFNEMKYLAMLGRWQGVEPGPLWVTAPDVVGDAAATLALFDVWEPLLHARGFRVALVGQDGLETMRCPWERMEAFFVGGSTEWKLSEAAFRLCREAKLRGKLVHVGRVNSARRMEMAARMGADTIDGSGYSRWKKLIAPGVRFLRRAKWLAENQPLLWE